MNTITWDKSKMRTHTHFYPICPETLVKYEICADTAHTVCSLTFTLLLFLFRTIRAGSWKCIATQTTCQPASQPDGLVSSVHVPMYKCMRVWITESDHMNETRRELRFGSMVMHVRTYYCSVHIAYSLCGSSAEQLLLILTLQHEQEDSFNPFIQLISWNWKCAADNYVRKYTHSNSNAIWSQGMVCECVIITQTNSDQWIISFICGFCKRDESDCLR